MTKRMTILLLAVFIPGVAFAQINKCLDAGGKVVGYGAECPSGTRSEQTNIKNTPGAAAPAGKSTAGAAGTAGAATQKSAAERDADFRKRQIEKQDAGAQAEKKAAFEDQRKRACDDSRVYLKSLQERQRITKTDPKTGERIFLSDGEYPAEVARAQQGIAANCK